MKAERILKVSTSVGATFGFFTGLTAYASDTGDPLGLLLFLLTSSFAIGGFITGCCIFLALHLIKRSNQAEGLVKPNL